MADTVLAVASARVSDLHCSPFAGQEAVPASCWGYDGPAGPHPTVGEGADAVDQGPAQAQPTKNRDYSVADVVEQGAAQAQPTENRASTTD